MDTEFLGDRPEKSRGLPGAVLVLSLTRSYTVTIVTRNSWQREAVRYTAPFIAKHNTRPVADVPGTRSLVDSEDKGSSNPLPLRISHGASGQSLVLAVLEVPPFSLVLVEESSL